MKQELEIKIEHLQAQNSLFTAKDYLTGLKISIEDTEPNDKWKLIANELGGICLDIEKAKLFLNRVFKEMEYHAEINYTIKTKGIEYVVNALNKYDKLKIENEQLKNNI